MKQAGRVPLFLLGILLALQGADLVLTWNLLTGARPDVYEANPIALAMLQRFGWVGVALFKGFTSGLAVAAVLVLVRYRPAAGRRVLGGLCLVLLGVVGYSGWLLARPVDPQFQEISELDDDSSSLTQKLDDLRVFAVARTAICADLLAGRVDVPTAVRRMSACLIEHERRLAPRLRITLPSPDAAENVAAYLHFHTCQLVRLAGSRAPVQTDELWAQISRSYPAAARLEGNLDRFGSLPPWSRGEMVVHVRAEQVESY